VRRDRDGKTVSSGPGGGGWQDIAPGSAAENIWKMVCTAARPPRDEPFLKSLGDGAWRPLGQSGDRKFILSVKTDAIVKLDATHVGSYERSDYAQPEWIDGFAVRYIVAASVVDCANEKTAAAGIDLYVSPSLRVKSLRIAQKDMQFEPIAPGAFLAGNIKDICAAAKPIKTQGGAEIQILHRHRLGRGKGLFDHGRACDRGRQGHRRLSRRRQGWRSQGGRGRLRQRSGGPRLHQGAAGKAQDPVPGDHGATLGRGVFTLGYPAPGMLGEKVKMTAGQVNSTSGLQDDTRMLQISIPVQGGNSGGPVLEWGGAVVGVVDSKLLHFEEGEEETPQNVNYAVQSSYLRPMLEDLPDLGNYEGVKVGPSQEKTVAAVREAVFMLLVAR
jgi:hypothetical protein